MRNVLGKNLWDLHSQGKYITITTNGFVKRDGSCVMGAGIAEQAKTKFVELPRQLGKAIQQHGNNVFRWDEYRLFTFPVKHVWWEKADLELIRRSLVQLAVLSTDLDEIGVVQVGCGNGKLNWSDVKPLMEKYLDDKFVLYAPI